MKFKLSTVILYVKDVDLLKVFYTSFFMLEVVEEYPSTWVLLKAGGSNIAFHKIGAPYLDKIKEGYKFDNNTKIVFEIEDDITKIRQQLIKQKVIMREIKTFENYGYWLCDGEDPEGNVFQLKQKK